MRLRIKQARPTSLNDAVRHAVELEAFHKAERSRLSHQGIVRSVDQTNANSDIGPSSDLRQLQESLSFMNNELQQLQQELREYRQSSVKTQSSRPSYQNLGMTYRKPQTYSGFRSTRSFRPSYTSNGRSDTCKNPRPNNQKAGQKEPSPGDKNTANAVGSGLYTMVDCGGQMLECLIDTGAALTVLSASVWDASDKSKLCELKPYDKPISMASGSPLDVKGKVNLLIEIAGRKYAMDVLVASIDNDILLGLDFMVLYNALLTLPTTG